jgi:hypothetical protein
MFDRIVTTLLTQQRLLFFIMTMNCASSGLTTWLQNRFTTWKCKRMQFVNGFTMLSWKCFTFQVGSTLLISLQRRCAMGPFFDAYKILSRVLCLVFFSSLCWIFISCVSIICLCLYRSFHRPLLQQLLSPGVPISWLNFCHNYLELWTPFLTYQVLAAISSDRYIGWYHRSWYDIGG